MLLGCDLVLAQTGPPSSHSPVVEPRTSLPYEVRGFFYSCGAGSSADSSGNSHCCSTPWASSTPIRLGEENSCTVARLPNSLRTRFWTLSSSPLAAPKDSLSALLSRICTGRPAVLAQSSIMQSKGDSG